MPTCVHCATPVPDNARFCYSCGTAVSDAEGQAAVTASMDNSAFLHMETLLREDTAGEFEIERMLGRGGMAVVYLATEVHLSRKVAIKVLPPELTFGHGVERFKREAKTAAALDHPHIIPIYRVASGGKLFWYAMKFLEGRALDEMLKERERFPLDETIDVLSQAADALDYAHEHQVIHRDIKPANVMFDNRGRVVVTDFGIAKALTEGTLTASGSVIGTPYFMSPEQGMGKPVTGAADQYSVAVMAYRMLSGQVPFEGDSAIDIIHKHCMMPPPPLETVCPGLPRHVYLAIHRGLEKEAGRRFASVGDFVKALKQPAEYTAATGERTSESEVATLEVSAVDLSGTAPAGDRAPTKRRRGLYAGIGVVVVIGAVATGWFFVRPGPGKPAPTRQAGAETGQLGATEAAGPVPLSLPPPPAPTTGEVVVTGLPADGVVLWNGEERSTAFEVPAGSTLVMLRAPGYRPQETAIMVVAGGTATIPFAAQRVPSVRPRAPPPAALQQAAAETERQPTPAPARPTTALLRIALRPPAEVFINGQSYGEQARFQHEIRAGMAHQLRFRRAGFASKDTTVTPTPGDTLVIRVRLERNK